MAVHSSPQNHRFTAAANPAALNPCTTANTSHLSLDATARQPLEPPCLPELLVANAGS
jgi:hypothetical protein